MAIAAHGETGRTKRRSLFMTHARLAELAGAVVYSLAPSASVSSVTARADFSLITENFMPTTYIS